MLSNAFICTACWTGGLLGSPCAHVSHPQFGLQTVEASLDSDQNIAAVRYSTLGLVLQAVAGPFALCTPYLQAFQGIRVRKRPEVSANAELQPS